MVLVFDVLLGSFDPPLEIGSSVLAEAVPVFTPFVELTDFLSSTDDNAETEVEPDLDAGTYEFELSTAVGEVFDAISIPETLVCTLPEEYKDVAF